MNALDPIRPTVVPALLYLLAWPIFMLLPTRGGAWAPVFFIASSLVFVTLVDGPAFALGLGAAAALSFLLIERIANLPARSPVRQRAFAALMLALHFAYLGCFYLPTPDAYQRFVPREADQAAVMVFFSGIALTFFRIVSFAHDRCSGRIIAASWTHYLAYVLFFPQFRHGPIERYAQLAPQLENARQAWRGSDGVAGLLRILTTYVALIVAAVIFVGLGRLTGVAERVTDLAAAVRNPQNLSLVDVAVLVHMPVFLLYALEWASAGLQLAVARVFGIRGSENFDRLWLARNPPDYWRRWQTTLGAWIQDYAFRPLARRTRNPYIAIALACIYCGLLHGPQLRCVAWGVYNGLTVAAASWWLHKRSSRNRGAPPPSPLRAVLGGIAGRLGLLIWMSVGMTLLVDPDGCGLPLLARYVELLAAAVVGR